MSGGHWNYSSGKYSEIANVTEATFRLMAALEHELDWAVSGDSCRDCTMIRTYEALKCYFDSPDDASRAIAVAKDGSNPYHLCDRCKERQRDYDPTGAEKARKAKGK